MEILLIGNGFDLEHNLPTSYKNFLEFCERTDRIFSYVDTVTKDEYKRNNLDGWDVDDSIKNALFHAFEERMCKKISQGDGTYELDVSTSNPLFNELHRLLDRNTWLKYFLNCTSYLGENWIDFESEISRVVQALDAARFQAECGGAPTNVESNESKILTAIWKASKKNLQEVFKDTTTIDKYTVFLNSELDRLIRALEIYIAEFVHNIQIPAKSVDIEKLNPDHVLSFNYSDTYERIYGVGKNINYDYIHGKADINKNINTCNLVLGIDEYLDDDRKDRDLEFLTFKKYYQRIYKSTGNDYLNWIDIIQRGYEEYVRKEGLAHTGQPDSLQGYPFQKRIHLGTSGIEYPRHTLYIFGHSLDVTDKDVLKKFICNDNVQTKIFYYRESEDDKKTLAKLIKNLVKIIGQDELIRRTGGSYKTIEFISQSIHQ